jgi:hypothetical protein
VLAAKGKVLPEALQRHLRASQDAQVHSTCGSRGTRQAQVWVMACMCMTCMAVTRRPAAQQHPNQCSKSTAACWAALAVALRALGWAPAWWSCGGAACA